MSDPTIETREELFLSAAAGESVTLPDPETSEEVYLAKAAGEDVTLPSTKDNRIDVFLAALAEGGGSSVTVEPLSVTENGTYTALEGTAYSPVTVNVPNPNSIVTVQGTIGEPFGALVYADLLAAIKEGSVTARIDIEGFGGYHSYLYWLRTNIIEASSCRMTASDVPLAIHLSYNNGALRSAQAYSSLTGIEELASTTQTTLTIIHHPMPTVVEG